MNIQRIDGYSDLRFLKCVLNQHGAYLVHGIPYEVEIVSGDEAVVKGEDPWKPVLK